MKNWLEKYLNIQIGWSLSVFGSGHRTEGILKHIESEIEEVRNSPYDVEEWVDIVILALDGAWRAGHLPEDIIKAMQDKQTKNCNREWPAPVSDDEPIMHIKDNPELLEE